MVVANVHLDSNPERSDIRIEQLEQVKAEMELEMARCDDICGIVCGDFNFLPESEEEKTVPGKTAGLSMACPRNQSLTAPAVQVDGLRLGSNKLTLDIRLTMDGLIASFSLPRRLISKPCK